MNKLIEEAVCVIVIVYVGVKTLGDMGYNQFIEKDEYWNAFFNYPFRFLRYNGEKIKEYVGNKII